jgi:methylated-DNA-protein-cysteine methyltransferase related protein
MKRHAAAAARGVRRRPTIAGTIPVASPVDPFEAGGLRVPGRRAVFFRRVYAIVRRIPRGRITSYGAIARALGVPRGARTVGWALSACPNGVPWHRVVNAQGKISWRPTAGYALQRTLLRREGIRFNRAGRIDFDEFGWKAL